MFYENIIVGAGASGLMCGIFASSNKVKTLIIERNNICGKKMLLTGGGRCNVTNNKKLDDFIENIPRNSKFCYSFLNNFLPRDIIHFFMNNGLKLREEDNNRMFPITNKSKDVVDLLENKVKKNGADILYNSKVIDIYIRYNKKYVVLDDGKEFSCNNLVIATGGSTYKRTGSDGMMYEILKKIGHTITDILPSETSLNVSNENFKNSKLQGISLEDVIVSVYSNNKLISNKRGEILFTHNGISGPAVLKSSYYVINEYHNKSKNVEVYIDLLPNLTEEEFLNFLKSNINYKKNIKNIMKYYFCDKIIDYMTKYNYDINYDVTIHNFSLKSINRTFSFIKQMKVDIIPKFSLENAFLTSGGVKINEINPKTLESKIVSGLYFIGEVVDINAFTGGYNLTLAFAMGKTVGENIS